MHLVDTNVLSELRKPSPSPGVVAWYEQAERESIYVSVLVIGELRIDLDAHEVTMGGRPVQLTPHEYGLLTLLARNEGKLLTHTAILRDVWGRAYADESHYLHVYVSQLRRKLEPDPARPRYILTEPGAGYRLVDPLRHS